MELASRLYSDELREEEVGEFVDAPALLSAALLLDEEMVGDCEGRMLEDCCEVVVVVGWMFVFR